MDVILSGRRLSAREALAAGLVARVVAKEAWLDEAKRVAHEIAAKGPVATRLAKESVDRAFETTLATGLEAERRALYLAFASEDAREGLNGLHREAPARVHGPLSRFAGSWPGASAVRAPPWDRPSRLAVELGRHELQLELPAFAEHADRHRGTDPLDHHQALDVVHARDRCAVELDDQVLGPQPGRGRRSAFDHLDHLDARLAAELPGESRRQRPGAACDA